MKLKRKLKNTQKLQSRSREGAWIEIQNMAPDVWKNLSRSREGAWIEIDNAGLMSANDKSRSREGAWIEILFVASLSHIITVAPVRERGLKSVNNLLTGIAISRSREGAWIEINILYKQIVWYIVAPVRERGLKSQYADRSNKLSWSLP